MMRKLACLGLLLVLSSGCGRGWLPGLFRGAPCGGTCGITGNALPNPAYADAGSNCATTSATYGSYDSGVVSDGYYGGDAIGDGYYGSGTRVFGDSTLPNGKITNPMVPTSPAP